MASNGGTARDIFSHLWDGRRHDKEVAAEWLKTRLGPIEPANIIVTNGAQNATLLALQHICADKKIIAVEQHTYHGFLKICQALGIETVPVEMDEEGLKPDALERLCRRSRIPGLYCMPTLQNPTTSTMSQQRRDEIADVAYRYALNILEDDVYGMLSPAAPAPIASILPNQSWYVSGFGKTVCAGLRIGYLYSGCGQDLSRLASTFKTMSTWFPAPLNAQLVSDWVTSGVANEVLADVRRMIEERHAIFRTIFDGPEHAISPGALHAWWRLAPGQSANIAAEVALSLGVRVRPGSLFLSPADNASDPDSTYMRVCLGAPETLGELECGLKRLARAFDELQTRA